MRAAALLIVLNLGADPISIGSNMIGISRRNPAFHTSGSQRRHVIGTVSDLRGDEGLIINLSHSTAFRWAAELIATLIIIGMGLALHTVDVASFEQIVQSANAVPTITVSLQHQSVLAPIIGFAVVFRQRG